MVDYIEDGHTIQDAMDKFNLPRSTVDKWYKKRDLMRSFRNTDKRTMHPGAQPKYRMKHEILLNLKFLNYLYNQDADEEEDNYGNNYGYENKYNNNEEEEDQEEEEEKEYEEFEEI